MALAPPPEAVAPPPADCAKKGLLANHVTEKLAPPPPVAAFPPPPPPVTVAVAVQPPGGGSHRVPAVVPRGRSRPVPRGSTGSGVGVPLSEAVMEGVPLGVRVLEGVLLGDTVGVKEGVAVRVLVLEMDGEVPEEGVCVLEGVAVGEGERGTQAFSTTLPAAPAAVLPPTKDAGPVPVTSKELTKEEPPPPPEG